MAIQHTLYISTQRLKNDSAIGGSVDDNLLLPYILMAQDRYILPVIGTDLQNKLNTEIQNNSLAGNYLTLLQNFIQPALVQFAFATSLPFIRLRMVNNAIVTMNTEQGSSVSHEELKPLINASIDQGEFYRKRLIDYLRGNTSSFPEYSTNQTNQGDVVPNGQTYYAGLNLDVAPLSNKEKAFITGAGITICC
ncbi:MAG: hypothetical protein Unbinned6004contig1002_37 [Prokaryotic dsDNA virus sp.]|nr:MAG: hypothetical protein Unbinned6004contig1002_37 [Prokaryotic dsDNA virus sp.]|tara:strand:- start:287 stop:865 length:579 start_codon:yes stop_codon:yes gene_type:complete